MELIGEVFNGGYDAWRRPIDGVADDGEAAVAYGIENAPAGQSWEAIVIVRSGL